MLRKNPTGHYPQVAQSAFIDPTAIICGHVIIEDNVFVGPYAVIRADEVAENGEIEPIVIKCDSNIQDGVVIHSKEGAAIHVGARSSIAHRSIVHGPCYVGDDVFIGFNSVVFNTHIGNGCVIRHNSVVDSIDLSPNFHIPPMTNVSAGFDLSSIAKVPPQYSEFSESVVSANNALVEGYKKIFNEL
ncbi:DapH/DapD/GlmU-related protein [Celerinatantimonas diazotrophica]|uniref:Carbonic anhydrase/acetyltransferase-like protein (Isoleucine patch superfamily) n=1 Tax=Celerinatantimonas diazotrophica TaxID=412034 RepID=A0A4R1K1Q8_9GAMM|nr:DapH/DapD/GlmU-related protein [Celerinatantimonas diazotrophica]TCK57902.1 carbonic anhydrase/acetyltransferase-like protein (isoleucine patch superfamily) [Celerinatantimonas diazotrophica]CAG9298030.1 Carbon dioxide concentrating mechanism protein CcmM [Celerinatantimonas diazotrophica]